ncbi:hypothetical protein ThrDRAFT_02468 [Frankia casuarinae]|uniref:Transcriptional regulator, XRE family n=3 Tax=Frankiaceae TaxID=74712 RepID=Q2J9B0_FRACC|nr:MULTISPECIES: helix-turn-helix transcriptional regulator [Frankia]ESZ99780.1 hypothetical protein CcI6DRAFT_04811 [Frankia sp. CcI6]KDA40617.1 hypothetical protein BMG523Draft_04576 [Frankia sp. BMG5.23]KFB03225.1 Helix-turn-helix domain [Frankia sp. Allo2]ABD12132.1 transcriptional regulator, XRE family [Frankia casuarinae]EYT91823.1 hypothetical protein ThrDRAFT_02468 [Frankia casuarinae]
MAMTDDAEMPLLRRLVGQALRRRRLAQGRTLRDVADAARVSTPYLSEIERGLKEASSEILAAVCRALHIRLSDLLDEVRLELARLEPEVTPVTSPGPLSAVHGQATPPITARVISADLHAASGTAATASITGSAGIETTGVGATVGAASPFGVSPNLGLSPSFRAAVHTGRVVVPSPRRAAVAPGPRGSGRSEGPGRWSRPAAAFRPQHSRPEGGRGHARRQVGLWPVDVWQADRSGQPPDRTRSGAACR